MTTVRTVSNNPASPFYNANAPALTGTAGALLTVLDAVLVNGFTGFTAAGWTKPFANASNKGCYKNSATDGTGFCLSIDDSASGTGGAKEALCAGYQTLSAVATGTGQFPTNAQVGIGPSGAGCVVARKSATADSTTRYWTIIADDTVFYAFFENGDYTNPTMTSVLWFGDFFSYAPTDPYRCFIIGRNAVNSTGASAECVGVLNGTNSSVQVNQNLAYTIPGHYIASTPAGVGTSIPFGKHFDSLKAGLGSCGAGYSATGTAAVQAGNSDELWLGAFTNTNGGQVPSQMLYPSPVDGGLWLSPLWIHHSNYIRGYFKGLWAPLQFMPLNHNDTVSGSGPMAGKSLLAQYLQTWLWNNTAWAGEVIIETSSTWS